ncbi:MAG: hypothetical protein AB3N63_13585 [Puniceicoccaceae bacterium]
MASNPIGPDKVIVSFQLSKVQHKKLKALAEESNMSLGAYVREILVPVIEQDGFFEKHLKTKLVIRGNR